MSTYYQPPRVFDDDHIIHAHNLLMGKALPPPPLSSRCKVPWGLVRAVVLTTIMLCILGLTYDHCIPCVVGVLVFSGLTMHCIPYMSVVFILAACVLLYHAIDYKKASIKVEVPLTDVIYVPTWADLKQYVKVQKNAHERRRLR